MSSPAPTPTVLSKRVRTDNQKQKERESKRRKTKKSQQPSPAQSSRRDAREHQWQQSLVQSAKARRRHLGVIERRRKVVLKQVTHSKHAVRLELKDVLLFVRQIMQVVGNAQPHANLAEMDPRLVVLLTHKHKPVDTWFDTESGVLSVLPNKLTLVNRFHESYLDSTGAEWQQLVRWARGVLSSQACVNMYVQDLYHSLFPYSRVSRVSERDVWLHEWSWLYPGFLMYSWKNTVRFAGFVDDERPANKRHDHRYSHGGQTPTYSSTRKVNTVAWVQTLTPSGAWAGSPSCHRCRLYVDDGVIWEQERQVGHYFAYRGDSTEDYFLSKGSNSVDPACVYEPADFHSPRLLEAFSELAKVNYAWAHWATAEGKFTTAPAPRSKWFLPVWHPYPDLVDHAQAWLLWERGELKVTGDVPLRVSTRLSTELGDFELLPSCVLAVHTWTADLPRWSGGTESASESKSGQDDWRTVPVQPYRPPRSLTRDDMNRVLSFVGGDLLPLQHGDETQSCVVHT